jgi:ribosome production factor 2
VIPGHRTSQVLKDVLADLARLKGNDCKKFTRNNDINPFETGGEAPLEFFCNKNDCSLFALATHTKKRPNNLILGRTFDFRLLDMVELGVEAFKPIKSFGGKADFQVGNKPCFVFAGQEFDTQPAYGMVKSMLLDMFRGKVVDSVNLKGLDHVISVVAAEGKILFRQYRLRMKKSGTKVPRVELEECGPAVDFSVRRHQDAPEDLMKEAMRTALEKKKKEKNVGFDTIEGKVGRLYMPRQEMDKIALKKAKGAKRKIPEDGDAGAKGAAAGAAAGGSRPAKRQRQAAAE